MRIRIPSERICRKFHLTYELKGAQKGVGVLTEYYGVRRLKVVVDGRKVGRGNDADYFENIARFTRKGFSRENVLHELYHHIVEKKEFDMTERKEEKEANRFVKAVMGKR